MVKQWFALILMLAAGSVNALNPTRELEPNDTPANANYFAVAQGPKMGRVADFNDIDVFMFYSPGANINVTVGVAAANPQGSLSVGLYRASDLAPLDAKEIPSGLSYTFTFPAPLGYYQLVLSRSLNTTPPASDYTINTTWDVVQLPVCPLDVDGNGKIDALTDGLMFLRAMFGLTGDAITNNAIGAGATRKTYPEIRAFMNANCGTNVLP